MLCLSYFSPVTFSANVGNRKVNKILVNIELEDKAILEQYYHTTVEIVESQVGFSFFYQITAQQNTSFLYVHNPKETIYASFVRTSKNVSLRHPNPAHVYGYIGLCKF